MRNEPLTASSSKIRGKSGARWSSILIGMIPVIAALGLWASSLSQFDIRQMTDLGLISVLPISFILSLIILAVGFIVVLQQPQTTEFVSYIYLASFLLIIHGTPQILYGTLRYSWAWKHVAIIDYIQRHGTVDPSIQYLNIYHNWPGFFTLNTLWTELAGIPSAIEYAGWAPFFFNIIDLGALLIIFRSFTSDRRLIWLGVWFFFLANWIGQDYFSPQALTYFLYLIVLGIYLSWFGDPGMPTRRAVLRFLRLDRLKVLNPNRYVQDGSISRGTLLDQPYQRVGAILLVLLAMIAVASTHQLTPMMLFAALAGLVILRVCQVRSLPVTMAVIIIAWIIFLAVGYLHGSILVILTSLREFLRNLHSNLVNLSVSSPGQVLVAQMDRGLTIFVVLLAGLGFLRRLHHGKWDLPALILTITPLPLLVIPYGAEIIFRIYFFALPFLAFFAAGVFFPRSASGKSLVTTTVLIITSCLMMVGFGFGYYGKEKINNFPPNEVAAATYIIDHAQPGALIYSATWDWPLVIHNYENFQYETITNFDRPYQQKTLADPVGVIGKEMSNFPSAYLILTNSQKANIYMTGSLPPNSLDKILSSLASSPRFKIVYQNPDAVVFTLAANPGG